MPELNVMMNPPVLDPGQQSRGRWILFLLFLFFSIPLLLVLLMHRYDWHPQGGNSHGELIVPVRMLHVQPGLQDASGKPIDQNFWRDKWSMLYLAADCNQPCVTRLHDMRQLHASLAKDVYRVQRVLLTEQVNVTQFQQQYPDLVILNQHTSALNDLRQQVIGQSQTPAAEGLYLVDPLGNLMMVFPDEVPAASIRKDIVRLLNYAWAG